MNHRRLGSTGRTVSEVGLGTWNIGGSWGEVSDETGRAVVRSALDAGIDFLDTADVYGDGRSERHIAHVLEGVTSPATSSSPRRQVAASTPRGRPVRLRRSLAVRRPKPRVPQPGDARPPPVALSPTDAYYQPSTFEALERFVAEDRIANAGVSVEREEALKAIEYDVIDTVQIIFNPFRQRPKELFFERARRKTSASSSAFPTPRAAHGCARARPDVPEDDHRNFNREGEAFDVGETFAGVPYETGHDAVEALEPHVPKGLTMAELTLRWILDHEAVSTVIPGTTSPEHVRANAAASDLDALSNRVHGAVRDVYEEFVSEHVHHRW